MTKKEHIDLFNNQLKNVPITLETLQELLNDYLDEINYSKDRSALLTALASNPALYQVAYPTILNYYITKYSLYSISKNNKILLYYATD